MLSSEQKQAIDIELRYATRMNFSIHELRNYICETIAIENFDKSTDYLQYILDAIILGDVIYEQGKGWTIL